MSTGKKVFAAICAVLLAVLLFAGIGIMQHRSQPEVTVTDPQGYKLPDYLTDTTLMTTVPALSQTTAPYTQTLPAGTTAGSPASDSNTKTTQATATPAAANVESMSKDELVKLVSDAVNRTKAYTGTVSVHHQESFDANVTRCTGGDMIVQVANSLMSKVLDPSNETLNFSAGTAVNTDGEQVVLLLPQRGEFTLTGSGVSSASAFQEGSNIVVVLSLIPESVGMNDIPAANAAGIGYLDVSSIDSSFMQVTSAEIDYTGSAIRAVIRPDGYIQSVTYTIPLHVEGAAKAGLISGSAAFDGQQTEIWDFNW